MDASETIWNVVNGTSEQQRTPTTFVMANNANTLWTPAAGKRFRLMGFMVSLTADAASATNDNQVQLQDGGVTFFRVPVFTPTTAVTTVPGALVIANINLPGNGYLSTAANNVLTNALAGALTSGIRIVDAWGCEE